MDFDSTDDRAALAAKVDQVVGVGVELVCLALDDIPFGGAHQGLAHAALTTWLREHLGDRASARAGADRVRGAGADAVPRPRSRRVCRLTSPIAWTGDAVVNAAITVDEARARAAALGGRAPLVWDNYPGERRRDDRPAALGPAVGA